MKQFVCNNLAIGYDGHVVRKDINLEINPGDYLCIIGQNGAGKSTLIKTILGLLPPVSGNIEMCTEVKSTDIGYLPQQTQIQKDFPASVWEVVLSGCLNRHGLRPFYNKAEKNLSLQMMEKTGIIDLKKKSYSKLSGGQQQRVLLTRALCATSKILLLDEPVAGLDPNSTLEMYKLINNLNDDGITIIMITHDVKNAIQYSNYILDIGEKVKFMNKNDYLLGLRGDINE